EKIKDIAIWKEKEVARVVIDRKTNASNIYYFGEVEYCDNCGLHFLIKLMDDEIRSKVEAAIRLLGDEGIGGDRSYGKGLFEVEFDGFEWNIEEGKFLNLSLYLPKENEIEMVRKGWYEIVNRSGWVYSVDKRGERKRFVRMIKEGSTFSGNKEFYGKLIDVSISEEHHHIYRYGYGMPLYIGGAI
ncbi:MAG TPA: type III-A CRISPR-associated RAMP protein Csm4, partial [Candidatus Atribacteria bacterium]|nr:type III-A CRISPR-associated RAMP protein Csm4 [Candidatus Atribacteria bacterium]